jgi:hypothetical protein
MPKKRPQTKTPHPPNAFTSWPHKPEYTAIALIRKGGLWAVLQLKLKARQVIEYEVSNETSFEPAIDRAIRRLAQSVRRA